MSHPPDPLRDPRFADLVNRLHSQESPPPPVDFAERVMTSIRCAHQRRKRVSGILLRAAASVVLVGGIVGAWMGSHAPLQVAESPSPVDILMASQRADGGWATDPQQLRSRYDVGVTALAILALMNSESIQADKDRSCSIRSGIDYLVSQQAPDGRFGNDFSGMPFNHYLATMALRMAIHRSDADLAWIEASTRAQRHLPSEVQMAKLNQNLANPAAFPSRWAEVGGPVAQAALQTLQR